MTCPSCGYENAPGSRFCSQCGARLTAVCGHCSAELPSEARFCPKCGRQVASQPETAERKLVTALFADVASSTAIGDQMDVERVRSLLNAYFSAMSATIDSWGGTVEKFIGDAILAYFGVPRVREDDAERAVRAALQMLGQLIELNEVIRRQHGVE
jgi:class 3 adenylate cyclase